MELTPGKKIYFASDFHLGVPDAATSRQREALMVRWLTDAAKDAQAIYLVGDVFDFWFEYKTVVPKHFSRLLGKLCEIADSGIELHLFHGNHDLWQFGYFEQEIGCTVHSGVLRKTWNGVTFVIAHGDGLGPGQRWFKFILSVYRSRFAQRLFSWIHPDLGVRMANWFSSRSKENTGAKDLVYLGDDREYLMQFALAEQQKQPADFYIFGHRHLAFDNPIPGGRVINLGDWFSKNTYAVFDGQRVELKAFGK